MKKTTVFALLLCLLLTACTAPLAQSPASSTAASTQSISADSLPAWDGMPYVILNGNRPTFTEDELSAISFELYSPMDALGRCGMAEACIGIDLMPTEERGSIGQVKPSGWQTVKYDIVDGKYLYNRCHLIGYQLSGENANQENLITGTRYFNVEGMLPFENMVADYVEETENHVLYRVTPVYEGTELVARGVRMEALSVEDGGEGICFHVFIYNVQPGITIDYQTGESQLAPTEEIPTPSVQTATYILNTSSKKFHLPDCSGVVSMKEENKEEYTGDRQSLIDAGYTPCKTCEP